MASIEIILRDDHGTIIKDGEKRVYELNLCNKRFECDQSYTTNFCFESIGLSPFGKNSLFFFCFIKNSQ